MNPYKVLIIDDDAMIRMTIKAYLEDSGYIIAEADNGRKGIEVFSREKPDIVITDLRMPGMDGFDVIAKLKKDSPGTPVVVITGTGDRAAADEAIRRGAYEVIFKPVSDMKELETIIRRASDRIKRNVL